MNKSRITYRFDSQGKEYPVDLDALPQNQSTAPKADPMLNQYTYDFGTWNSPFDTETSKLEQLIRETDETHLDQGEVQHYALPQAEIIDRPLKYYRSPGKKASTPIFKIFASLSAAVLTGTLFGFFALSMFDGNSNSLSTMTKDLLGAAILTENASGNLGTAEQQTDPVTDEAKGDEAKSVGAIVTLAVPAQSFYMLQNGVFSNSQGAETAKQELMDKGLAAAYEAGDKFAVFAGVSADRDDALLLKQQLQQQELEVYVKPYELPAIAQVEWAGAAPAAAQNFFVEGRKLAKLITDLSLIHLGEQSPTALDAATLQSVRKSHQAWGEYNTALGHGNNDQARSVADQMAQSMNTAAIILEEYTKNPSAAYLWDAQTSVMQYVVLEKQLISLIAHS